MLFGVNTESDVIIGKKEANEGRKEIKNGLNDLPLGSV